MLERLVLKSPRQRGDDGGGGGNFFPHLETLAGDDGEAGTFWQEMISSPEMIKAGVMLTLPPCDVQEKWLTIVQQCDHRPDFDQPSLGGGKKWSGGGVKKSSIFSLGDDTIPGDGQVKKLSSAPPPPFFLPVKI